MIAGLYFGAIFILFLVGFGIVTAAWIYTLIDAITREDYDGENDKLLWVLVILFAGIIGSIIYYFVIVQRDDEDDNDK